MGTVQESAVTARGEERSPRVRHDVFPYFIFDVDSRKGIWKRPRMRFEISLVRREHQFSRNPQTHATDKLARLRA